MNSRLDVVVAKKLVPHAIVHCFISADELMQQIHENHHAADISFQRFRREEIMSCPIQSGPEAVSSTVIEGTPTVTNKLTSTD